MEITSKFKELENPPPLLSPSTTTNGGNLGIPITRSDPNSPYPTTFVTADTSSFKHVVQMLTGSSDCSTITSPSPHHHRDPPQQPPSSSTTTTTTSSKNFIIPPVRTSPKKQQGFKLYERRNSALKNMISPLTPSFGLPHHQNASFSPRHKPEILSPSLLDFPSLTLSPVTPLLEDPFDKSSPSLGRLSSSSSASEEERAIAEKGFYLHPSPMSTPRDVEPQLLPLFPLSSPRVPDSNRQ